MSAESKSQANTQVTWDRGAHRLTATMVYPLEAVTQAKVFLQTGDVFVGPNQPDGAYTAPQLKVKLGFYSPTQRRARALLEEQMDGLDVSVSDGGLVVFDRRADTRALRMNSALAAPILSWHVMRYKLFDVYDLGLLQPRCDVFVAPPPDAAIHYDVESEFGNVTVANATGTNSHFKTSSGDVELVDFTGDADIIVRSRNINADVSSGNVFVTNSCLSGNNAITTDDGAVFLSVTNNHMEVRASTSGGILDYSGGFVPVKRHGENDMTAVLGTSSYRPFVSINAAKDVVFTRFEE